MFRYEKCRIHYRSTHHYPCKVFSKTVARRWDPRWIDYRSTKDYPGIFFSRAIAHLLEPRCFVEWALQPSLHQTHARISIALNAATKPFPSADRSRRNEKRPGSPAEQKISRVQFLHKSIGKRAQDWRALQRTTSNPQQLQRVSGERSAAAAKLESPSSAIKVRCVFVL